jgi:hypothetical protein
LIMWLTKKEGRSFAFSPVTPLLIPAFFYCFLSA